MTEIDFGQPLPSNLEYAISFGIPTWDSAKGYAGKDPKILNQMVTGYPRYFPQPAIQKLSEFFVNKYGQALEGCRPFPSRNSAQKCLEYVRSVSGLDCKAHLEVETLVCNNKPNQKPKEADKFAVTIAAVLASDEELEVVKEYWKLTGEGVSSRLAVLVNTFLGTSGAFSDGVEAKISHIIKEGEKAKRLIKERVADNHCKPFGLEAKHLNGNNIAFQPSNDVHLASSGMAAIFTARKALDFWERSNFSETSSNVGSFQSKGEPLPCVIFGFPFKDTQVIMDKFGSTIFMGLGDLRDLIELRNLLETRKDRILAVFVETPSNPLLNMPDLAELRRLADVHGFFVIIDDTIGGLNVNVLPYADIVCTSITKLFSGASNVMGGSILLNPKSSLYSCAREYFESGEFEDLLWSEDAVVLESNSRDFEDRTLVANRNTEQLLQKILLPQEGGIIKKVYYPTVSSEETFNNYEYARNVRGGYGCLFSLSFHSEGDARSFYDSLKVYKGPSNGTNFTLACSYVQLAHHFELEKVSKFGADPNLVRVSVGLEDIQWLLSVFSDSVEAVRRRHSHN